VLASKPLAIHNGHSDCTQQQFNEPHGPRLFQRIGKQASKQASDEQYWTFQFDLA